MNVMATSAMWGHDALPDLPAADAIGLLGQHDQWPTLKWPAATAALAMQAPWLAYWSTRLDTTLTPAAARDIYAAALDRFDTLHERTGALLALAALIETYYVDETPLHPMDRWIAALQQRLAPDEPWPNADVQAQVMACGLAITLRDQTHPLLARWAAQGQSLLRQLPSGAPRLKLATFLLQYHGWRGEFGQTTLIVDALPGTAHDGLLPSEAIVWYESVANHARFTARHEQAQHAIDAALQLLALHNLEHHRYALHAHAAATALGGGEKTRA
jgi:hypothetical protein